MPLPRPCRRCGKTGKLESAHIISEKMARMLIFMQFSSNGKLKNSIASLKNKIRRRNGDLWLCEECHKISDDTQKEIEKVLWKWYKTEKLGGKKIDLLGKDWCEGEGDVT